MHPVAVASYATRPCVRRDTSSDTAELVRDVTTRALDAAGVARSDVGFVCSGSSDYLRGVPFAFVAAVDGLGAWPPIEESHVEMDGAWALYEAWVRLQHGDIDAALVFAFGISSAGDLDDVLPMQLDPYTTAPLWPDPTSLAALQARAMLDAGVATERDFAEVVARSRRSAVDNPNAQLRGEPTVDELLAEPYGTAPLRRHDRPPISDSAAAIVLTAGGRARGARRPAWIGGIAHAVDPHQLGARDLTRSESTEQAARAAELPADRVQVAEVHAPFSPQEILVSRALALPDTARINPSGGALAGNPLRVAGLQRIGEAAARILDGTCDVAVGHASAGPCLQQNVVCWMEAR